MRAHPPRISHCQSSVFPTCFARSGHKQKPWVWWLYSHNRAEGMKFITCFDWVTPCLNARSKQLLDFHSLTPLFSFYLNLHSNKLLFCSLVILALFCLTSLHSTPVWHPWFFVLLVFLCCSFFLVLYTPQNCSSFCKLTASKIVNAKARSARSKSSDLFVIQVLNSKAW